MTINHPVHPGEIIRYDCMEAEGLTIAECAERMGMDRGNLSRLLNGHIAVTARTALELEALGWSNAAHWLRLQAAYDLALERRKREAVA